MSQGTWHRIAAQLGWPVDASVAALRDAPPDTQRIALELARTYQKLLRPFEEVWTKSLLKQQQNLLESHRAGQQQQQQQQQQYTPGNGAGSTPVQGQAPPLRPPSQNAGGVPLHNQQGASGSQLEASRQQLLQQAKAASLSTQQVQSSPALSGKAQLQNAPPPTPGASKLNVDPTAEQLAEAKVLVSQIRQGIESSRRAWDLTQLCVISSPFSGTDVLRFSPSPAAARLKVLEIPQDQKVAVAQITHELIPAVRQVVETLPLFLAVTNDREAVRKMLTFVSPADCLPSSGGARV